MAVARECEIRQIARRRYWGEAEGRLTVETWQRSNLSALAFCRRHGLTTSRLAYWRRQIDPPPAPEPIVFHPVPLPTGVDASQLTATATPTPAGSAIEVRLGSACVICVPAGVAAADLHVVLQAVVHAVRAVGEGASPC